MPAKPAFTSATVNLKLLHTFLLVGEQQSFRAAAELLHRSGSAVSSQIRSLEEQLGLPLFHRTTRNVRLTADGERLLRHVQHALREVDDGLQEMRETSSMQRGRVALACAPTIACTYLGQVLAQFESRYPGIEVFVREITASVLYEAVRRREVDFGLSVSTDAPEFRVDPILVDPLVAVVPKRWLTSDAASITVRHLATLPLLVLEQGTALRKIVEDAMRAHGLALTTRFQCTQSQTLVSMAEAGLGAAVLPQIALPAVLAPSVRKLRIVRPGLQRRLAIITLRGQSLSPAAQQLSALLREQLALPDLQGSGTVRR